LCPNEGKTEPSIKARNPILEGILDGELPAASSIALIGAPGTGTSMLAIQYVVKALLKGKKVIFALLDYVPQLAHKYFRQFGFNAEAPIADGRLQIVDAYALVRDMMGISSLTDIANLRSVEFEEISRQFQTGLMGKIRNDEEEPSSVVVDSFTSLAPFLDVHSLYEVLAEGFATLRKGRHSTLAVAHEGVLESNFVQTLTRFVDGVIRLDMQWSNLGPTRELYIEKLRLTNVEVPAMDFSITDRGISLIREDSRGNKVAKRHVARTKAVQPQSPMRSKDERISSGIPALDTILDGGFPKGTFICIEGDVGTGTTTLCTQFAWSSLVAGRRVAYYCVDEPPETVVQQFQSYGWDITPYIEKKSIVLSDGYNLFRKGRIASLKGTKDAGVTRRLISEFMKAEVAKLSGASVVAVIDSFTTMAPYLDLKTAYVLARIIADNARMSDETYLAVVRSGTVEANLLYACLGTADGIVRLENNWTRGRSGSFHKRMLVRKMRIDKMVFTPIPSRPLEYEISAKGIQLNTGSQP
jgi:KaiC/GvpD/RAD55 family RecA-like ATPase